MMPTFSFISLGCAKNRVDSEIVIGELLHRGYQLLPSGKPSRIVIINTCAFLEEARREALQTISKYVLLKKAKNHPLGTVVLMGCFARYLEEFGREYPLLKAVDLTISPVEISSLPALLDSLLAPVSKNEEPAAERGTYRRFLTSSPHSVNIKITDGCANHCSYCLIPVLRGPLKSRPMQDILSEVQAVERMGAKEINLVGQDITLYGYDLENRPLLLKLLQKMAAAISSIRWIRLLYLHPARISEPLIDFVAGEPAICKYIDLPIQHINRQILQSMGRGTTPEDLLKTYERLRERIPGVALRTTVMTGYPGENEQAFRELLHFLRRFPFDRLGCFPFSPEKGTRAFLQEGRAAKELAEERSKIVMEQQQSISRKLNRRMLGRSLPALVDSYHPGKRKAFARIYSQAPEVDGRVIIAGTGPLRPGKILPLKITAAGIHDFIGERMT